MPTLMVMHTPMYRKVDGGSHYVLHSLLEVKAQVAAGAPFKAVWDALNALQKCPAAVFCAGDKTTYTTLDNDTEKETWNVRYESEYQTVQGWVDSHGFRCVGSNSSVVFADRGLLCTVPVPDYCQGFVSMVPGSSMREHLRREARRQRVTFTRLRDNVQFIDVYQEQVLGCLSMEGGKVGQKRKRNYEAVDVL